MSLNLIHLLLLHAMLVKFFESDDLDESMKSFLHDLILMFEIYIDGTADNQVNYDLKAKYNYQPLKSE